MLRKDRKQSADGDYFTIQRLHSGITSGSYVQRNYIRIASGPEHFHVSRHVEMSMSPELPCCSFQNRYVFLKSECSYVISIWINKYVGNSVAWFLEYKVQESAAGCGSHSSLIAENGSWNDIAVSKQCWWQRRIPILTHLQPGQYAARYGTHMNTTSMQYG